MDKKLEIILTAKDMTQRSLTSVRGRIQKLSKDIFSLRGAFVGAAAVAGMGYFIKRSMDAADNIAKIADKLGISTAALQEYRFAASQAGVAQAALDMGVQRFTRRVAEAAKGQGELKGTLEMYGIAATDAQGRTRQTEDVLADLADVIANTESGSERLRIAFKAFDSEGVAMMGMLLKGSAGLNKMRQEARDLGIVLSGRLIYASADANDELDKLGRVIKVHMVSAVTELSPNIAALTADINAWVKENQGLINQKLPEYFEAIKKSVGEVFKFFGDPGDSFKRFLNQWGNLGDKIHRATRYIQDFDRRLAGLPAMSAIFGGGGPGERSGAGGAFALSDEMERAMQTARGGFTMPPAGQNAIEIAKKAQEDSIKNYSAYVTSILSFERQKAQEIGQLAILEQQYREEAWQKTLDARKEYEAQAWEGIQAGYWAEYELMKDVEAGVKESLESINEAKRESDEVMKGISRQTGAALQNIFSTLFFDFMTGELKTLKDYASAVFKSMASLAAQALAQIIALKVASAFATGGGSFFMHPFGFHEGGVVGETAAPRRTVPSHLFLGAPRLHSGLSFDEYPAILQKGEMVIPAGKSGNIVNNLSFYFYGDIRDESDIDEIGYRVGQSVEDAIRGTL